MKNFNSKKFTLCLISLLIVGYVMIQHPDTAVGLSMSLIAILSQYSYFNTKEKKDACSKEESDAPIQ